MSSALRLNLARSPFVNRRPVRRLSIALWVLGGVLLVLNVFLIWSHRSGTVEGRAELTEIRQAATREVELSRRLRDELSSMDLSSQNAHVDFLNQRIAHRTFPWSRLFEQLTEVMPRGVRLRSLFPGLGASRRGRTETVLDSRVRLAISAEAEDGEAMLEFVDRLFQHPAFEQPDLQRETATGSIVAFQLDVMYRPELETSGDPAQERAGGSRAAEATVSLAPPPAADGASPPSDAVRAAGGGSR